MLSFKKSLAQRTFVLSLILLSLPLLVDSFIVLQDRYRVVVEESKKFLLEESSARVFQLSRVLRTRAPTMHFVVQQLALVEPHPLQPTQELNDRLKTVARVGLFSEVVVIQQLKVIGSSYKQENGTVLQTDAFYENIAATQHGKKEFSFIYSFPEHSYLIFGSTIPKTDAMILFAVDLSASLRQLLAPNKQGEHQFQFAVLNDDFLVLAAGDTHFEGQSLLALKNKKDGKSEGKPFFQFEWDKRKQVGVLTPIPDTEFYLLSYADQHAITTLPLFAFLQFYTIYALILACGGCLAYLLIKRVSRPFTRLSSVMEGIQRGDLTRRYSPDPLGFEINELGIAFNNTIDALIKKKKEAEDEHVKSEIYENQLRIGQQVQRSLLTENLPAIPSVALAARYQPAKEVGGDFYDVFLRDIDGKQQLVCAIADASGKGVHACFYSLDMRSSLRTFAHECEDLNEVLKHTNTLFYQDTGDSGMFVTLLVGVLDPIQRTLSYGSLGHNAPILRRKNGECSFLEGRVFAAGIVETIEPHATHLQLEAGDTIVFYTDGVTEAQNSAFELFSEQRLLDFVQMHGADDVHKMADDLLADIKRFENGAPQHDDITLLIIKML